MSLKIQLFENQRIRTAWDEEKEEWYFSIVDVVGVLTDSVDPTAYWRKLKQRLKAEGNETVTNCHGLKMTAPDGKKRLTDVADTEQLLRIIQSIPSPKAEPFKLWLAQVGRERIEETIDPELTIERALETYLKKGYTREWINQRLQAIQVRKELTDEWDARGVQKGVERVVKVIMVGLLAILVLLVSVFKLPALLGMGLTVVVSIVFAMVFQGVNFVELMNYAANGFTLSTGVDIVDPMLNRGGITSMTGLLITFMVASVMGGIITATGILDVLAKDVLLKFIKSRGVLVTVTLIYCYIVNFLTAGGQTVAIIVTEQTFEDAFDRMGIHRRVLSRTLEDAGTLSAPIVPWGVATLYVMEVLGCGTEYIPYCWFIFIVPIFSILCAFSGFGIWDKDGNKMWGRKKAAAK